MQELVFDVHVDAPSKAVSEKFYHKFSETYDTFRKKRNIDTIRCKRYTGNYAFHTRAYMKTLFREDVVITNGHKDNATAVECFHHMAALCKANLKQISETCTKIDKRKLCCDPFKVLKYDTHSAVQEQLIQDLNKLPYYGGYAYSCSCGAGKTLAGIYCIYALKVQTLIISTRCAVNDQWCAQLNRIYPHITIAHDVNSDADIYILTPQYIKNIINKPLHFRPGLIIYDEVHNMLAACFLQSLLLPFVMVNNDYMLEIPYLIALSATYPKPDTREYKYIQYLFGTPKVCPSSIVDIPINVYDYYDHYKPSPKEQIRHKRFDSYMKTLNDMDALKDACKLIDENPAEVFNIDPCDTQYVGIVMTRFIKSSIQAAAYLHEKYNCNILLIRATDKDAILFEKDVKYNYSKLGSKAPLILDAIKDIKSMHEMMSEINVEGNVNVTSNTTSNNTSNNTSTNDGNTNGNTNSNINSINNGNTTSNTPLHTTSVPIKTVKTVKPIKTIKTVHVEEENEEDDVEPVVTEHAEEETEDETKPVLDVNDLKKAGIGVVYDYIANGFNDISIIVSTVQRLREGFSVQNAVWGICTSFSWSYIARVQILGRIRRNSNNDELNNHRRIMICYEGKRPSTIGMVMKQKKFKGKIKHKWLYDTDYEHILFNAENYIRI